MHLSGVGVRGEELERGGSLGVPAGAGAEGAG